MRKLLIVDDEDGIRSLVRMTLDSDRYEILEAKEASEARDIARDARPELILLDVMLPDGSGVDLCRELKNDPITASATVVMLTAKAQLDDLGDAEQAGADGYFTKPFSPIALLHKVEEVFGTSA